MMTRASKWFRRVEIALWVFGLSMIGVSVGATVNRWQHQATQQRAVSSAMDGAKEETRPFPIPSLASSEGEGPQLLTPTEQYGAAIGPERPEVVGALDHVEADHSEPAASVLQPELPGLEKTKVQKESPQSILTAFGRIEIPRIGLSAVVEVGSDEPTLERAVGLIPGTAKPGEAGNVVLAGHRDTFFRPLRNIEVNDTIRLVVPPNSYEYRVESLRVVPPTEVSVMDSRGLDELTLITCYPFRWIGPAPDRFIVRATRVVGSP